MKVKFLLFLLFSILTLTAGAVKAKPGLVDFTQPDGSVIKILLHGDERFHYTTDPSGRLMHFSASGRLDYAPADLSIKTLQAQASTSTRGAEPKYRYTNSAFPTTGTPHSLVVLVEYQDYGFSIDDPLEYYEDFLNGDNFTRNGGTGSCRQYFIENSKGEFQPTFDVYGPVKLKNKRVFYGGGREDNAKYMVVEAVEALDDLVDFSQYDHNGDGYVDSIYIIYAEKGEASGGPSESVWPYSFELEEEDVDLWADGVKFNTYGCSNELNGGGGMEGIGTFTHEFGHVLGLPDLYNTERASDNTTPGYWSVMDCGNYNNDNRTPCNMSSFERYSLGWLVPEEIVCTREYSLASLPEQNAAFIMTTESKPDEFFILEYRRQEGWDKYLPSHGMLIWHIDFHQMLWDWNEPNNVPNHQRVDLLRADNTKDMKSYGGDPFPGNGNVTVFSTETEPALLSWNKEKLNVTSLSNIREEDDICMFEAVVTEEREPSTSTGGIREDFFRDDVLIFTVGNTVHVREGEYPVYDLSGRKVGTVNGKSPITLNTGFYIIAGKKIFI